MSGHRVLGLPSLTPQQDPGESSLLLAAVEPQPTRGEALAAPENAPTVYDAVTAGDFTAQEKGKEKNNNAGETVRCYFRTRQSILGDSKGVIL